MGRMNWGYVAGFLDGEGCVYVRVKPRKSPLGKKIETVIIFVNSNKEVLEAIKRFLRVGYVVKPREYPRKWAAWYELRVCGMATCYRIAKKLLPYSIVKREKLKELIRIVDEHLDLIGERIRDAKKLVDKAIALRNQGRSLPSIADSLGVTQVQVKGWLTRGRIPFRDCKARFLFEQLRG